MINYVLDTNVLLHDPNAIQSFGHNDVYLPLYVFDELDKFKKELSQRGKSAREVIRRVETLREEGSLFTGVSLGENKGKLYVKYGKVKDMKVPFEAQQRILDNAIIGTAKFIEQNIEGETIFVTLDVNLRLRADAIGLKVQDYHNEGPRRIEELYSGIGETQLNQEKIDYLYDNGFVDFEDDQFYPQEFLVINNTDNPQQTVLTRYLKNQKKLKLVIHDNSIAHSCIKPRNKEQTFGFDILLDPQIRLITLVGKAGTGKTLLAIAAGLEALEHNNYKSVLISRPIFPMGRDMGFLPGDIEAKLNPWMQPIFDNMELIAHLKNGLGATYKEIVEKYNIRIEPLTYIRGRSLPNQYMIVDEAQNLTPHEVKTIITRAGEKTKIILTGDPYQIDNPYVDSTNNGLSYIVEKFKNEHVAGHITLEKGERSTLAELASNIL
ncbi:MAG: PhoH family protein [Deltaproteobacteria bacterium]|jgi:PhoH-like ATPase|nr:PhoH family protein [Deltaproteobacteria bacterium]